ncbi:MAG: hypothetical protein AAF555_10365 [Verrucomicrobiota bacterium]
MSPLVFHISSLTLVLGLLVLAGTLVLSWFAWTRRGRTRVALGLEVLRFLCVLLGVVTLWQPEWRSVIEPDQDPEIVVLIDDSPSMTTEDVLVGEEATSRQRWVAKQREASLWETLQEDNRVTFETFGEALSGDGSLLLDAGTDLNSALRGLTRDQEQRNLRAAVLFSDGDWTSGNPPVEAATRLSLRNIPVFSVLVGSNRSLPDLEIVSVSAPAFAQAGERVQVPFTVRNTMPEAVTTTLRLREESGKEYSKTLTLPSGGELSDALFFTPVETGLRKMALLLPEQPGEMMTQNNEVPFQMTVRDQKIKVLVVETLPRWEYRYIRNALSRDPGVEVSCLLFHPDEGMRLGGGPDYISQFPNTLQDLSEYDVVFLGDVGIGPGQLTVEQCQMLRGLVEQQASGLVFIPGSQGHLFSLLDSPLGDLVPVILDETQKSGVAQNAPSSLVLTSDGKESLLTMLASKEQDNPSVWKNLPGFYWHAPVLRNRGGATVLAVHETRKNRNGRIPLLVTRQAGTGKILFMGTDGAWRWRRGVEDLYHYRFWGQVARWMSYQRKMAEGERLRVFYAPDSPEPGDTIVVNANAYTEEGIPLQEGQVLIDVERPDGSAERFELVAMEGGQGAFYGRFRVEEPGEYGLSATCRENGNTVTSTLFVAGQTLEQIGRPAKPEVLQEIAKVTKGGMGTVEQLAELVERIAALPEPLPIEDRLEIWNHWIWATLFVLALSLFWVLRKLAGMI